MSDGQNKVWAACSDEENWHCQTLDQLIAEMRSEEEPEIGRVVHFGEAITPDKYQFVPSAVSILDQIDESAWEVGGEHAEGYAEVSKEGIVALDAVLHEWAEKYLDDPTFWTLKNVKEYVLTADDLT